MSRLTLYRITAQYVAQHYAAIARRVGGESGQDLVEYAGMLAIIALIVGAIFALGLETTIATALSNTVNSIVSGSGTTRAGGSGSSGGH